MFSETRSPAELRFRKKCSTWGEFSNGASAEQFLFKKKSSLTSFYASLRLCLHTLVSDAGGLISTGENCCNRCSNIYRFKIQLLNCFIFKLAFLWDFFFWRSFAPRFHDTEKWKYDLRVVKRHEKIRWAFDDETNFTKDCGLGINTPHNQRERWTRLSAFQWVFATYSYQLPVAMPPAGVRTPEALLTAVLVKEPVTGIERTKEPKILLTPSAIISCVASIAFPFAETNTNPRLKSNLRIPAGDTKEYG